MSRLHITYILVKGGIEKLPPFIENSEENRYLWYWCVGDDFFETTCWGYLCYYREGEEDLFKREGAKLIIKGRYYIPATILMHLKEFVEFVWPMLLSEKEAILTFLETPDEIHFRLYGDNTVSIAYHDGYKFIRSYEGIGLENLREEFYRFGKSLLEGYVFKVRPDLRKHPDFAKLAEDLETMMKMEL